MRALIVTQQFTHRFKLAQEQLGWVDTHRQMCARANHSPQVITTAAAYVENGAAAEVRQVRQYALPLPVRAPFGIDVHAIQRKRPFTPWHQVAQQRIDALHLTFAQRRFAFSRHAVQQVELPRLDFRQKFHRIGPLLKQTVLIALPGTNLCRQRF